MGRRGRAGMNMARIQEILQFPFYFSIFTRSEVIRWSIGE